jgi:threonine dehydratase
VTKDQLIQTHERISPYIHKTAVLTSSLLDKLFDAQLYFKSENFQKMGAFKIRGATNAIMLLSKEQRARGVLTHSSGNFAQALSLAANSLDVKAYIVMPSSASQIKKEAVKSYGGIITECEPTITARERAALKIEKEKGATFIHPSNDIHVILGQATVGIELVETHRDLDFIFAPVGGGGLIAGTALAVHHFGKDCQVIGGEPLAVDDAYRSLLSGKIEKNQTSNTIADGLKTHLGSVNFPIIQQYVRRIIRVEEDEIINAMKLIWERIKIVIEPSSAVAFAAFIKEKQQFKNKKIGIILSGGNVDLAALPF